MRSRVVWAVVVLVVVAVGIGVFAATRDDDESDSDSASSTTTTTAGTTTSFDDSTTTTSAAAATSSTTVARSTTSTSARATTTTAVRATTATGPGLCGSGKASASFTAKDLTTDALSSTFTPEVTVDNQVTASIEVEEVTIEVTYPNTEVRTVRFATAGTVIGPGTSASFASDKLTSAQRYQAVRFSRFTYFTEGRKADCRVTTP